ncbi:hypothetical protein C5T95_12375 [Raoultella ornithinolytica]|nr:hypothetical protein C5T95_12375 [Raoultella ornithinolytica]HAU5005981.1 hypothetical protein [Raoultella ornithinolytica]
MFGQSGFTHGDLLRGDKQYVGRSLKVNGPICRDAYSIPPPILGIPVSFLVFPMLQRTAKRPAFALCMLDCFSLIIVLPNRASTRSSGKFADHRACQYRL